MRPLHFGLEPLTQGAKLGSRLKYRIIPQNYHIGADRERPEEGRRGFWVKKLRVAHNPGRG